MFFRSSRWFVSIVSLLPLFAQLTAWSAAATRVAAQPADVVELEEQAWIARLPVI